MRRNLLLFLGLYSIFLQAYSQISEPRGTFQGNLKQKYNETVSRSASQNYACGLAPVGSYYSSHYAAVDLSEHPEACGRCLQASCVDLTQCRSPFLNVTVVVIDDCPGCGEGGVSMNSLAVRELTGRSLEENEEDLKVQWTLFECSATAKISVPPPPSITSPPPALAPPTSVAVPLAAPTPEEEKTIKEEAKVEVKAAPSPSPPAAEVENVQQVVAPVPAPEAVEEELIAPPPQEEDEALEVESLPVPLAAAPAPELKQILQDIIPLVEQSQKAAPPPQQEEQEEQVETDTYYRGSPASRFNNGSSSRNTSNSNRTTSGGLPGDDVLTLPRVGNICLAVPVDYQPFPEQAFANIACGFASVSTHFKTHFAGMASGANACGSCLAVRCADPAKCPYGAETVVQVVDTCGSCEVDDLNISPDAFKAVMGSNNNSYFSVDKRVVWRKVPCRGLTESSMYLHIITGGGGSNDYYAQMSISNAAQEIKALRINKQALARMNGIGGGRWEWQNNGNKLNLSLPAVLEVTGMDGTVVIVEIQKFESQELPSGGQI